MQYPIGIGGAGRLCDQSSVCESAIVRGLTIMSTATYEVLEQVCHPVLNSLSHSVFKQPSSQVLGRVTTPITVANLVDQIMAIRGTIPREQIRTITLENVLVDTGATRLCLPADIIQFLGLVVDRDVDVKLAVGFRKLRSFKGVSLSVQGREGTFNCLELPPGEHPLLGLIPLEDLGLDLDMVHQRLRVLPSEGRDTYLMM